MISKREIKKIFVESFRLMPERWLIKDKMETFAKCVIIYASLKKQYNNF